MKKKSAASEREQAYIDALDRFLADDERKDKQRYGEFIEALDKLARSDPSDPEARALLALWMWQSARKGLPLTSHVAVDSVLGDVFDQNAAHPAHHYRIHLWDREDPSQALASAARCGQAAPAIAHMWHMPGHIYSRLKRYRDAAWQQEASARADHAYMVRDRILPDQIHNYAHNNEWLIRNLIFLGRSLDALSLAKNMLELPRHPAYNAFDRDSNNSCKYGRRRLMQVLETFCLWDETIALAETMYLEPTDQIVEQAKRLRLLGVAYHHRGDWAEFAQCRDALDKLAAEVESLAREACDDALADLGVPPSPVADDDESPARARTAKAADGVRQQHAVIFESVTELQGLACLARGDTDAAASHLRNCQGIPALRRAEYAFRWGDHAAALDLVETAVKKGEQEVPPLALQVDLLRRMGRDEDAAKAFGRLRELAGDADLESGLLSRLAPLAQQLQWPVDWRLPASPADDVGDRPALDTLGPLRWSPPPAEDFDLPDALLTRSSLADYRGRPVVLIFYLGYGCLHCTEQLQKFAAHVEDFAAINVELLAISTDTPQEVATSIENFSPESKFAIRLLSDFQLDVFKQFRCFDDFEQTPMHGTLLIDSQGRIRWLDIGYQPFDDVAFLRSEAERLLSVE